LRDTEGDHEARGDDGLGGAAAGASRPGVSPTTGPEADSPAPRTDGPAGIDADSVVDTPRGCCKLKEAPVIVISSKFSTVSS
jgi:hypothetical protein